MTPETKIPDARRSPRERLLEAAGELFYAEGVQSVGIDRVIERAGVAKASLYSTFGSKEELVRAYLDERHARIVGRLQDAADAVDPADPVARILAVFDAQAERFPAADYHLSVPGLQVRPDELLFAPEGAVERGLGDAGALDHAVDPDRSHPLGVEQLAGRLQQALAR